MRDTPDLRFDNVALAVTDLDRSIAWYGRVFGFEPVYKAFITGMEADFVILRRCDLQIELLSRPGIERAPEMVPGPHLATSGLKAIVFKTDDLEAATAYFEDLDLTLVWRLEVISDDGMRATMIRDPDGHLINVLSYPERAG